MKPISNDVEEIDGDEVERILTCAAAIDVAKASGMVCVRRPHSSIRGSPHVAGVGGGVDDQLDLGAR